MSWRMVALFIVISLEVDWDRSGHWPSIIPRLPREAGLYGQSWGKRGGKGPGQEFAGENWVGTLHVVTVSGWNEGATT